MNNPLFVQISTIIFYFVSSINSWPEGAAYCNVGKDHTMCRFKVKSTS